MPEIVRVILPGHMKTIGPKLMGLSNVYAVVDSNGDNAFEKLAAKHTMRTRLPYAPGVRERR